VFCPPTTGELLKWKVIVSSPLLMISLSAGVPLTVKSLAWTVAGSAGPLRLTVNSVGAVATTVRPQMVLVTVQPGGGVGPLYSSALLKMVKPLTPPAASTFPLGSKIAVCTARGSFRLPVSVHIPLAGSYSSEFPLPSNPPSRCNQHGPVRQQGRRMQPTRAVKVARGCPTPADRVVQFGARSGVQSAILSAGNQEPCRLAAGSLCADNARC
jgi:hypothetical protein